jgi:predicted amidohydrolase YtcJ
VLASGKPSRIDARAWRKGLLEAGKLADLAVLSADPMSVADTKLRDISAVMTMVGGRIVHATSDWPG